jgi:hypothetical protein
MKEKTHAALTTHGFTKSVRKTHPVALSLVQAKAYTALAVLSCSLLPSVSYLYRAFNAEDHLLSILSFNTAAQYTGISFQKIYEQQGAK